jgi:Cu(I)/Ag(I) efflux system membrane protein CusA/SilA
MLETIITFKDPSRWREGMTYEQLRNDMEAALQVPGLVNSWTYPIRGRIDMLLSGIRTPVGIKLYGSDAATLQRLARAIEQKLMPLPESQSVFADRSAAGYYIDIDIDETALQRYGLSKAALLEYTRAAIGGMKVTTLYKGIERYSVALRLEEDERRNLDDIRALPVKTPLGFVPLSTFADVRYRESASVIKSEMATPVTYVYITPRPGVGAVAYKEAALKALADFPLPPGYHMEWAGQAEYLASAMEKMRWIVPAVLAVILLLIYLSLRRFVATLIVFLTLPFALLGGIVYVWMLGFSMSIAVIVGFLALLGIAAETAIVMIVYLTDSVEASRKTLGERFDADALKAAINEGAVKRVRPKLMTVFSILAGLAPIMYTHGVGSEVMQRIAAPMLGGIVTSALLSLLIIPILYEMHERRHLNQPPGDSAHPTQKENR